jgi:hypothetical protein
LWDSGCWQVNYTNPTFYMQYLVENFLVCSIRIHNDRSQQQKSNDNSENFLVNCVFTFAYDNNCLYWIENKLFLFIYFIILRPQDSGLQLFGPSGRYEARRDGSAW